MSTIRKGSDPSRKSRRAGPLSGKGARKRIVFAASLSALTIFGGHFYNRRWSRAGFFGALLFTWMLLFPPTSLVVVMNFMPLRFSLPVTTAGIIKTWSIGLLILCLASCVTAAFDAAKPKVRSSIGDPFFAWAAVLGLSGLGGLIVLLTPFLWTAAPRWKHFGSDYEKTRIVSEVSPYRPPVRYLGSISVVSYPFDSESNKELAAGGGKITGRAMLNQSPLAGLKFRLLLNGDLHTGWVETRADGTYRIGVPRATYRYAGWEIDPESAQKVLSGMINLSLFTDGPDQIMEVQKTEARGPDLDFASPITTTSPLGVVDPTDEIIFSWKPFSRATMYIFQLEDWGPAGDFPTMNHRSIFLVNRGDPPNPVRATNVSVSELHLSLNPHHSYSWSVEAYDLSRRLISRTPDTTFRTK